MVCMIRGAKNTATRPTTLPIIPAFPSSWPRELPVTCAIRSCSALAMNPKPASGGATARPASVKSPISCRTDVTSMCMALPGRRSAPSLRRGGRRSATQGAEDDAHQGGCEHDCAHPDKTCLHGSLAHFELVGAAAGGGVLDGTPHEGEDANRNRYVADGGCEIVEQTDDVCVHRCSTA